MARALNIPKVVVPPHPGILCAQGLIVADQLEHFVATVHRPLGDTLAEALAPAWTALREQAAAWFLSQDVRPESRHIGATLDMRYAGQNFEIPVPFDPDIPLDPAALSEAFSAAHRQTYGFDNKTAQIEVTSVQLAASGRHTEAAHFTQPIGTGTGTPVPTEHRDVWFDRREAQRTPVYDRTSFRTGQDIAGPAIIEQLDTTTVLFPGDHALVAADTSLVIEIAQ
ncbi:MAG TPA: hypothetical protein VGC31_03725 [Paenirhodobacter sp.]